MRAGAPCGRARSQDSAGQGSHHCQPGLPQPLPYSHSVVQAANTARGNAVSCSADVRSSRKQLGLLLFQVLAFPGAYGVGTMPRIWCGPGTGRGEESSMASLWSCMGMQGGQQQAVQDSRHMAGSSRLEVPPQAAGALQRARPGGQSGGAQSAAPPEHQRAPEGVLQSSQENVDRSEKPSLPGLAN